MKKNSDSAHKFTIPPEVSRVPLALEKAGFQAYLVGGCVRDLLLGKKPKDWDVTTNAKPDQIIGLFEKTFYENTYGTVGVVNEYWLNADETNDGGQNEVKVGDAEKKTVSGTPNDSDEKNEKD